MGNVLCGGPSKEERDKRSADLRKNVTMTEHAEDIEGLLKKLETDATKVKCFNRSDVACAPLSRRAWLQPPHPHILTNMAKTS